MPVGQAFTVSGTGSNLFENNVVVRAFDQSGAILAEQATTLDTDTIGGSGAWSVDLTVQTEAGTPGNITAFSPSPVEGQEPTGSSIAVTYGQKPIAPTPLPTAEQPIVPTPEPTATSTAAVS